MKILFLAPQPFFQERGTPIAVRLALTVLSERLSTASNDSDSRIDLLTYHEGSNIDLPCVRLFRIPCPPFVRGVRPGISIKKLICDLYFLLCAIRLVIKERKVGGYDVVHAVEESVFVAMVIKLFFGIPYIYDMDSSLALQLTEKWRIFRPLYPLLYLAEKAAVKWSLSVVPVCDALAAIADRHGSSYTHILRDISMLDPAQAQKAGITLKEELGIPAGDLMILYIGNLEPYQGIDLLLDSFAQLESSSLSSHLVIIGGNEAHIKNYREKAEKLRISERTYFTGPKPVANLSSYLLNADILVSPRIRGNNTPMKIYSYLHSGKAIVATNLPTHTQVMDNSVAVLADPNPAAFAAALRELILDERKRKELGSNARRLAEKRYTFD
ncbi:MAG: glycosyltransferase, partial [Candidatus Dadabacteria bacterium]